MDSIVFGPLIISGVEWHTATGPRNCDECEAYISGDARYACVTNPVVTARLCAPCGRALEADACTPS